MISDNHINLDKLKLGQLLEIYEWYNTRFPHFEICKNDGSPVAYKPILESFANAAYKKKELYINAAKQRIEEVTKSDFVFCFNLLDLPRSSGVYFLIDKTAEVIYIGQSVNIYRRIISGHNDKPHKYYGYVLEKVPDERIDLEKLFIEKYDPVYNIQYRQRR